MKVPEVPDKSTAKTKPAQASRRILYLQTGMDFYRHVRKPCCASQQSRCGPPAPPPATAARAGPAESRRPLRAYGKTERAA